MSYFLFVRYFMSNLVLQSSWWGRESWLLCLICLPGVSWWLSGSSWRCHRVVCSLWLWNPDHTHLLFLKNASGDDRIIMLEYITPGQMASIGEIAHRIYHHTFPLLIRDLAYFEDKSFVLRILFSLRVYFGGKVATLVRYHRFLSRLLRRYNP